MALQSCYVYAWRPVRLTFHSVSTYECRVTSANQLRKCLSYLVTTRLRLFTQIRNFALVLCFKCFSKLPLPSIHIAERIHSAPTMLYELVCKRESCEYCLRSLDGHHTSSWSKVFLKRVTKTFATWPLFLITILFISSGVTVENDSDTRKFQEPVLLAVPVLHKLRLYPTKHVFSTVLLQFQSFQPSSPVLFKLAYSIEVSN